MKRKNLICYWNFHFEGKTEAQRNSVDSQGFDILDVISKSEKIQIQSGFTKRLGINMLYNWMQNIVELNQKCMFPIREKTTNHVVLAISPFHHFPWDVLYAAYEWKTNLWNLNVGDKIILFLASRTKFENYNLSLESSFIGNFCFVVVFDKVS